MREVFRQAPGTLASCHGFCLFCQAEVTYAPSHLHPQQQRHEDFRRRAVRCLIVCLSAPKCRWSLKYFTYFIFESATRKSFIRHYIDDPNIYSISSCSAFVARTPPPSFSSSSSSIISSHHFSYHQSFTLFQFIKLNFHPAFEPLDRIQATERAKRN